MILVPTTCGNVLCSSWLITSPPPPPQTRHAHYTPEENPYTTPATCFARCFSCYMHRHHTGYLGRNYGLRDVFVKKLPPIPNVRRRIEHRLWVPHDSLMSHGSDLLFPLPNRDAQPNAPQRHGEDEKVDARFTFRTSLFAPIPTTYHTCASPSSITAMSQHPRPGQKQTVPQSLVRGSNGRVCTDNERLALTSHSLLTDQEVRASMGPTLGEDCSTRCHTMSYPSAICFPKEYHRLQRHSLTNEGVFQGEFLTSLARWRALTIPFNCMKRRRVDVVIILPIEPFCRRGLVWLYRNP